MEVPPQAQRDATVLMAAANDARRLDVAAVHEKVHGIFAVFKAGEKPLAKKDVGQILRQPRAPHETKCCEHQRDRQMVRVPGASRESTIVHEEVVS